MTETIPSSNDALNHTTVMGQRFLVISSVFPPDIIGGAEMSAANLARWLKQQGADVAVLATAKNPKEAHGCREIDGLKMWRVWMPRAYPQFYFARAKWWQKPFWHLQDHFDPRNRKIVAGVLDEFKPDFVNIHVLQGIGYNALREIGKRKIPTTFFLHDLGLACFRMSMFKNGKECAGHCTVCRMSAAYKEDCVRTIPNLGFVSPSRANLNILAKYFPVRNWATAAIMNASRYPAPTAAREESDAVRFLFVGRLHATKGIDLLLEVAANLAQRYKLKLTVVGGGPDEEILRAKYGAMPWCTFTGFINQQEISNHMINSDVLCIPSVWAENSPGVVIHALGLGLPVIGSDKAGIPELVEHEVNGLLALPGDLVAWQTEMERVLRDPSCLAPWRDYALANAHKFDQDYLGARILEFVLNNGKKRT